MSACGSSSLVPPPNAARILVVEDDPAQARLLVHVLRSHQASWNVHVAPSVAKARRLLTAVHFDQAIIDSALPDGLGEELLSFSPRVPILMLTANPDSADIGHALKSGASDYLMKDVAGHYAKLLPLHVERCLDQRRITDRATALLRAIPDLVTLATRDGRLISLSESSRLIWPDTSFGEVRQQLIHDPNLETFEVFERTFHEALEAQQHRTHTYSLLIDGAHRQHEARIIPVNEDEALILVQDRTDAMRLTAELANAKKFEALGNMSAGIAHEINSPLQYVANAVEGIAYLSEQLAEAAAHARKDLAAEVQSAARLALEGIQRAREVVDALREFSHPGNGIKAPVDLNRLISGVARLARSQVRRVAGIDLQLDESLPRVPCIPGEIRQVLMNLIVNALHAIDDRARRDGPYEGRIVIQSERAESGAARIQISDNGCGMSEETMRQVFSPFFTTKPEGEGTGQGLSLARLFIEDHHDGQITLTSRVGEGTVICIDLPVAHTSADP